MLPRQPLKLHDVRALDKGTATELFIVEGDSASTNVVRVRDDRFQAVLPMQGKPLNAWKAKAANVAKFDLYQHLITALGAGWGDSFNLANMRYQRVILLFDPDADGIHCGALMLMFFQRWMRDLVDSGRLMVVRAPLYRIWAIDAVGNDLPDQVYAYSDEHFQQIRSRLIAKGVRFQSQKFRGLASLNVDCLLKTCVDPMTRVAAVLTPEDGEQAVRIFGGQALGSRSSD